MGSALPSLVGHKYFVALVLYEFFLMFSRM